MVYLVFMIIRLTKTQYESLIQKNNQLFKKALKKSSGSRHHSSVSAADESGVHDIPINISCVNHHHTSENKSVVRDTPNNTSTTRFNTSGNKSAHDTLNKSGNKLVVRDTQTIQALVVLILQEEKESRPSMLGSPLTDVVNISDPSCLHTSGTN